MRALVTGSSGMAGSWLVKSLEADGHQVERFDVEAEGADGDASVPSAVRIAVAHFEPEQVFHLAAVARPSAARNRPHHAAETNVLGALNILEAVRLLRPEAKVLLCGTSDEYGPSGEVVTEESPCFPAGPYGASKLAATALGMAYAQTYGMHVVATRAWMHTGPGSPESAAVSSLARKVVAVEKGQAASVSHGNLAVLVDLTDVRDVARAYRLAIGLEPGIYNVCGEDRVTLRALVGVMTAGRDIDMSRDPAFGEGADMPPGSAAKLHRATGWKPEIPLSQTIGDLMEYWRRQVASRSAT